MSRRPGALLWYGAVLVPGEAVRDRMVELVPGALRENISAPLGVFFEREADAEVHYVSVYDDAVYAVAAKGHVYETREVAPETLLDIGQGLFQPELSVKAAMRCALEKFGPLISPSQAQLQWRLATIFC